ncbi:MAG TPA: CoA transferase [Actinomycetales bacterium]|nr:CoA transferase [Actinomycetales bacterium]
MSRLPLDGVRIVALEQYISGPYCTMWLADCGAEVIKVERPEVGDPRRVFMPRLEGEDGESVSGGFFSFNRNKKSVTLDLQSEEGRTAYKALVATADVVVENLRPDAVGKLGIAYDDLRVDHEDLVYAAISGYGRAPGTPYAGRPAFDAAILGMAGITHVTGTSPDLPPQLPMYGLADMVTGILAGYQVLMALFDRERTGKGRLIDVSMYDSLVALNERPLMHHAFTGNVISRGPDRFQAPMGAYECSDGYVSLVVPNDLMWRRVAACIGRPELADDPRTATGSARAANPDAYLPAMSEWLKARTRAECVEELERCGVPAGIVQDSADVAACPHLEARGMFVRVDDPAVGEIRMPHAPVTMSDMPPVPNGTVPRLGEHNGALLGSLGLDPELVARASGEAVPAAL